MNRRILLLIFISGVFLRAGAVDTVSSQIDNTESAEVYYIQGKEYLAKGDYEKANEYFSKAERMLSAGEYKIIKKENIPQKEADINQKKNIEASKKDFNKPAEVTQKLNIQPKKARPKKGILEDKKKIEEDNNNILTQAQDKYQAGELDEVLNLYKQLIEKYPKNYSLHYNLGVIYLNKYNYLNAAEEFETVINLNHSDKDAYYNLGIIYESFLDDKEKAISYYKKYLGFVSTHSEKERIKSWINHIKRGLVK